MPSRLPPIVLNDKHDDTYVEKVRCVICVTAAVVILIATSSPEPALNSGQFPLSGEKFFMGVLVVPQPRIRNPGVVSP